VKWGSRLDENETKMHAKKESKSAHTIQTKQNKEDKGRVAHARLRIERYCCDTASAILAHIWHDPFGGRHVALQSEYPQSAQFAQPPFFTFDHGVPQRTHATQKGQRSLSTCRVKDSSAHASCAHFSQPPEHATIKQSEGRKRYR
jgi:hypothetical protein